MSCCSCNKLAGCWKETSQSCNRVYLIKDRTGPVEDYGSQGYLMTIEQHKLEAANTIQLMSDGRPMSTAPLNNQACSTRVHLLIWSRLQAGLKSEEPLWQETVLRHNMGRSTCHPKARCSWNSLKVRICI